MNNLIILRPVTTENTRGKRDTMPVERRLTKAIKVS